MAQSPASDARFRRTYDEHFAAVRSYCLRRLPVADANDAVSEVFLVAWRKVEQIPRDRESLPWLLAVARNVVRNAHRARRRATRLEARANAEPAYPQPGPEVQVVRRAADAELNDALERLPENDREVLRLRAWEGLTAPQIATVIGASRAATEKRLSRAMRRLETELTRHRPHAMKRGGAQ